MAAADPPPRVLPRGRHAAPREVVWSSQRERLLEGMAIAVAEKGYASVSVADVIAHAGVSRKTFYEHFDNKEACFTAAYDAGAEILLGGVEAEIAAIVPEWLDAMVGGLRCYLETLRDNPTFARTFLVEVTGAGPDAIHHRAAVHERAATMIERVHTAACQDLDWLTPRPPHMFRACVAALNDLTTDEFRRQGELDVDAMMPAVTEILAALLLGIPAPDPS